MAIDIEQAARVTGCIAAADPTLRTGGWRIALTGTAQSVALPTAGKVDGKASTIAGRFVRIAAFGANVQLAQGIGAAPAVLLNQISVMGTGSASFGMTIIDGHPEQFRIDSQTTHLGFIATTGAGFLEMIVADQPVV
jgi:hypothetical protein